MALSRAKPADIPHDAIILSKQEAIEYQIKFLKKWKDQKDLWAFNYGGIVLASLSAFTGFYINNHFRTRLKLFHYGQIATYLPLCVLPPLFSFILHTSLVLPDVVLQEKCAVCTELRSSAFQAFSGIVFPFCLAPMTTFSLALRYNTYPIPYITKEPMKLYQLLKKFVKPIGNTMFYIFVGHALAASIITYLEAKNIEKVHDKLILLEYEVG